MNKEKQQCEIEELKTRGKMIDLMIEEYEFNARINMKDFCDEQMRKDNCIQDCRKCVKEYFRKEAEKNE